MDFQKLGFKALLQTYGIRRERERERERYLEGVANVEDERIG
jgi:hypothetical protein